MKRALWGGLAAAVLVLLPLSVARADSVADFYKGKTITLYIGYSVGGGYDTYARLLAQYMGKYIPGNPNLVPKNMTGAGSLVLGNYLYNVAPKDGTAFGEIGRGVPFDPLFGISSAHFDASKFSWIGSMNNEVSVCVSWKDSGVNTIQDAMKKTLVIGGTGASADTDQFPKILNGVLGTKFKLVTGYPGGNEVNLAMERGEVKGRCGWSWSSVVATHMGWYKSGKIHILIQLALKKHPDLPNVPLVMDLAKTPQQKQMLKLVFARQPMGRPFVAPPGVPADRAAALRKAFDETMKDKDFLAAAKKENLEIDPVSGKEIQGMIEEAYQVPKAVAQRVADLLQVRLIEQEMKRKHHHHHHKK